MRNYLIWTLTANLAAMGELAGNEYRPTLRYPGRSAILGMVGAALGINRSDTAGQKGLSNLKLAVAIFDDGTPLRDYHTVQTIGRACKHDAHSYRDAHENAGKFLFTTPTQRDYRQNVHYGVALWNGDLNGIQAALTQPVYPIYLGRKNCPLSSPVAARVIQAETLEDAFRQLPNPIWMNKPAVAHKMVTDVSSGHKGMKEWRHDIPLSRTRREFDSRQVIVSPINIELEVPA